MKKLFVVLGGWFVALPLCAQMLDRVVAVVDNEIILESELAARVQLYVLSNQLDPNTPAEERAPPIHDQ